jgi:ribosomal protein S18 acetylase RimI-like enzyme
MKDFLFIESIKSNSSDLKLRVFLGITETQIDQLIKYSQQDDVIIKFTKDSERFKNRSSFDEWRAKDRTVYTLIDDANNLAGIIWFGEKAFPDDSVFYSELDLSVLMPTFSIRLYGNFRSKGFSVNFMKIAFQNYIKNSNKKISFIWLGVHKFNIAAQNTYSDFGFQKIGESPLSDQYIMLYKIM